MIDFDAYYVHRKKGFTVVVSMPAWWDVMSRKKLPPDAILVMRCGLTDGPSKWLMSATNFEKLYQIEVPSSAK